MQVLQRTLLNIKAVLVIAIENKMVNTDSSSFINSISIWSNILHRYKIYLMGKLQEQKLCRQHSNNNIKVSKQYCMESQQNNAHTKQGAVRLYLYNRQCYWELVKRGRLQHRGYSWI